MHETQRTTRRSLLGAVAAGSLLPLWRRNDVSEEGAPRMPVGFVSHGAPTLALDAVKGRDLARWAEALPRPRALVVVSAHWEATPVTVGTTAPDGVIHDFSGFPPELYELQYGAPGAPELGERVARLLAAGQRPGRAWDHGVWVPLLHMFPRADVPVLQVSLPSRLGARGAFDVGRALRPLRDEGVLILGSGGMVHNLRRLDWAGGGPTPGWATAFEEWAREALVAHDVDALLDLEQKAPDLALAHPTHEHLLPLLVSVGASRADDRVAFPVEGFELGSLSRTAVQLG